MHVHMHSAMGKKEKESEIVYSVFQALRQGFLVLPTNPSRTPKAKDKKAIAKVS